MPASPPRRLRAALDLRLLLGIVLVLASVAGVMGIVAAADSRVAVYAAASTLLPGDRIDADDLRERRVALDGDGARLYLTAADLPDDGLVVTAAVRVGELVPRAAVGTRAGQRTTTLVVQLASPVSSSVVPGAVVDIWGSSQGGGDETAPTEASPGETELGETQPGDDASGDGPLGAGGPGVLCADAIVVDVRADDDGLVAAEAGTTVEVLVSRSRVARLLQAIADDEALAIVPAALPLSADPGDADDRASSP